MGRPDDVRRPGILGRRFLRFGAAVVGAEERLRGERGTVAEAAATGALMSVVSALVLVWYVDVLVGYTLDVGVYGLVVTAFGSFWVTTAAVYEARGGGDRDTGGNEGAVPPGRAEVPGYVRPWRGVEVRVPDYVGRDRVVPDEAALNAVRRLTVLGVGAVLFTLGFAVQVLTALGPPLAGSVGIDGSLLSASTLDCGFLVVVGTMVLTVEFRRLLGDWEDWTLLGYVVALSVLVGGAYGFLGPEAAGVLALTGFVVVQTARWQCSPIISCSRFVWRSVPWNAACRTSESRDDRNRARPVAPTGASRPDVSPSTRPSTGRVATARPTTTGREALIPTHGWVRV